MKLYGLAFDEIESYWQKRSKNHKAKSVGFCNQSLKIQEEHYKQRYEFIIPKIPQGLYTLDYGCGIGRYSRFFKKEKYIGLDICQNLLDIAQETYPEYRYYKLSQPIPQKISFTPEMFFTATVLQHSNDEVVAKIFANISKMISEKLILCLYENTSNNQSGHHICFRTIEEYIALIEKVFKIQKKQSYSHVIHSEKHSLMVIEVEKHLAK